MKIKVDITIIDEWNTLSRGLSERDNIHIESLENGAVTLDPIILQCKEALVASGFSEELIAKYIDVLGCIGEE